MVLFISYFYHLKNSTIGINIAGLIAQNGLAT